MEPKRAEEGWDAAGILSAGLYQKGYYHSKPVPLTAKQNNSGTLDTWLQFGERLFFYPCCLLVKLVLI